MLQAAILGLIQTAKEQSSRINQPIERAAAQVMQQVLYQFTEMMFSQDPAKMFKFYAELDNSYRAWRDTTLRAIERGNR